MNKSKDFLVGRLNMISDSQFWPSYSVRKNLSFLKVKGKGREKMIEKSFVGKIRGLVEKRELRALEEKKLVEGLKSEREMMKEKKKIKKRVLAFDMTPKRHCLENGFYSDKHIKVLRVVPNDILLMKKLRKSREGLGVRSPRYEDPKTRMRSCVAQTD